MNLKQRRVTLLSQGVALAKAEGKDEENLRFRIAEAFLTQISLFSPSIQARYGYYMDGKCRDLPAEYPKGPCKILQYVSWNALTWSIDEFANNNDFLEMVVYSQTEALQKQKIIDYLAREWSDRLEYRVAEYKIQGTRYPVICLFHVYTGEELYKWLHKQKEADERYRLLSPGQARPDRFIREVIYISSANTVAGSKDKKQIDKQTNGSSTLHEIVQKIEDAPPLEGIEKTLNKLILFHDINKDNSTTEIKDLYLLVINSFKKSKQKTMLLDYVLMWNDISLASTRDLVEAQARNRVANQLLNKLKADFDVIEAKCEYFWNGQVPPFFEKSDKSKPFGCRVFTENDVKDEAYVQRVIDIFGSEPTDKELVFKDCVKNTIKDSIKRYAENKGLECRFFSAGTNARYMAVYHPVNLQKLKTQLEACGGENVKYKLTSAKAANLKSVESAPDDDTTVAVADNLRKLLAGLIVFYDIRNNSIVQTDALSVLKHSFKKSGLGLLTERYELWWRGKTLACGEDLMDGHAKNKAVLQLLNRLKNTVHVIQAREDYFCGGGVSHLLSNLTNTSMYRILTLRDLKDQAAIERVINQFSAEKTDAELILGKFINFSRKQAVKLYAEKKGLEVRFFTEKTQPDHMAVYHPIVGNLQVFKTKLEACGGQNSKYKLIPPPHTSLSDLLLNSKDNFKESCQDSKDVSKTNSSQLSSGQANSSQLSSGQAHSGFKRVTAEEEQMLAARKQLIPFSKSIYLVKFAKEDSTTESDPFKLLKSTCSLAFNVDFKYVMQPSTQSEMQWHVSVVLDREGNHIKVAEAKANTCADARLIAARNAVSTLQTTCRVVEPNFNYFAEGGVPTFISLKHPKKTSTYEIMENMDSNRTPLSKTVANIMLKMFIDDKTIEDLFFLAEDYSNEERELVRKTSIEFGLSWRLFGQRMRTSYDNDVVSNQHLCVYRTKSAADLVKELIAKGGATDKYSVVTKYSTVNDDTTGEIFNSSEPMELDNICSDESQPGGCCKSNCALTHQNILDCITNEFLGP